MSEVETKYVSYCFESIPSQTGQVSEVELLTLNDLLASGFKVVNSIIVGKTVVFELTRGAHT